MKTLSEFKKDFEKNIIEQYLCKDLKYQLSKSLDEAIVVLRELRNKYDNKYENLHIEIYGESYCGNDDNYISVELKGKRLETDEEFKKRIDLEYMRYQRQWDSDRVKYKYLKKLFEGDEE